MATATKSADKINYSRYCDAIRTDRQKMQYTREWRAGCIRKFAGTKFSEEAATDLEEPLNLLALYVETIGRSIIPKEPRCQMTTDSQPDLPAVDAAQSWMNEQIVRMDLQGTLKRVGLDSMFWTGIIKTGPTTPSEADLTGFVMKGGDIGCWPISPDDWVIDMRAKTPGQASYMGHRIRVTLASVKANKKYSRYRLDMGPEDYRPINPEGDERAQTIGVGYRGDGEEAEDFVTLWEIYLPRYRKILCFQSDNGGNPEVCADGKPLYESNWIGPATGPYRILPLITVPDNIMGKGPLMDLEILHDEVNGALRKLIRECQRAKEILTTTLAAQSDAERVRDAADGTIVTVDNVDQIKPIVMGGPNQLIYQFMEAMKGLFDWVAGNISATGGLAPQSKTATQDKMLTAAASAGVQDKQDTMIRYVSDVMRDLGWWWWHHPELVMETSRNIMPGVSIERKVYPNNPRSPYHQNRVNAGVMMRKTPWEKLKLGVDPYSAKHQTPDSRLAFINGLVTQLLPIMPMLEQRGLYFDASYWMELNAKYGDQPDLKRLFTIMEKPEGGEEAGGPSHQRISPPQTERTNVRVNRSEATQAGNQRMLNAMTMGKNAGGSPSANGTTQMAR